MQFQKIVLCGTIVSKPVIIKHDKKFKQESLNFEVSVKYILKREVIFSIVIPEPLSEFWDGHLAIGKQVSVEGKVDVDKTGEWRVIADWVQGDEMEESEKEEKEKILF